MMAGITALFTALPALIALLSRLGLLIERLIAYTHQNNLNAWITDLEKTIDDLEKSKTAEEKLNVAKKLADLIRGIGPQ